MAAADNSDSDLVLAQLSPAKRALYDALRRRSVAGIEPARTDRNPGTLSFAQERLWVMEQALPGGAAYNIARSGWLSSTPDISALQRALDTLTARHDALRTTIVAVNGVPQAHLAAEPHVELEQAVVPDDDAALDLATSFRDRPFILSETIPLRALLIRTVDRCLLVVVVHHIATDDSSRTLFWTELSAAYQAALHNDEVADPPPAYGDFAAWQRGRVAQIQDAELAFWSARLRGAPLASALPADRRRPETRAWTVQRRSTRLDRALTEDLREFAAKERSTPFMAALAAYAYQLTCWTGESEVVLGMPVTVRGPEQFESTIGLFVNTVFVRIDCSDAPTYRELVGRTRLAVLEAIEHAELPFEVVVDSLSVGRDPRSHIVPMMVNGARRTAESLHLGEHLLTPVELHSATTKADLAVLFTDHGSGFDVLVEWADELYHRQTVDVVLDQFSELLTRALAEPDLTLDPTLLMSDRQGRAMATVNSTAAETPDCTVHELIARQAARTPDRLAVGDDRGPWLTYRELDDRANQLAHKLRERGVGVGSLVAVAIARSVSMQIGILAILKAGAAYVPLDASYPADRLEHMLADCQAQVLLCDSTAASTLPAHPNALLVDDPSIAQLPSTPPESTSTPSDLAYVIYTSGSTGRPKAVMVEHRGVVNRLRWGQRAMPLGSDDIVLQKTPLSFDVSANEVLWPLTVGARLFMAAPDGHRDPRYLAKTIRSREITTVHFVPSMLAVFLESVDDGRGASFPALRRVLVSGEALPEHARDRLFELLDVELINLYGPTEASIEVTVSVQQRDPSALVTIGRPIDNMSVRVLDDQQRPLPVGAVGELHLCGVGLARGYLRRPELTAERFVDAPDGARLYRTGDRVRWTSDYEIFYVGRDDGQIKLRGQRIELGEIESTLRRHDGVGQAAVIVTPGPADDPILAAYVVPSDNAIVLDDVIAWLRTRLPSYMIPTAVMKLDAIPVSPAGKLDMAALPTVDLTSASDGDELPPRTDDERLVAEVVGEILGAPIRNVETDLFALGLNSLSATRAAAALQKRAGVHVELGAVFSFPTVALLAAQLDRGAVIDGPAPDVAHAANDAFPLAPAQERMLFLADFSDSTTLYALRRVLSVAAQLDPATLRAAVEALAARHDALRTTIVRTADGPAQVVGDDMLVPVDDVDLRGDPTPEQSMRADIDARHRLGFDLEHGPLWRFTSYRLPAGTVLLVQCHHIVGDAVSLDVLVRDLAAAYDRIAASEAPDAATTGGAYRDYVSRALVDSPENQLDYWRRALVGAPDVLDLPVDRPRPAVPSYRGERVTLPLGAGLREQIAQTARRCATTPFTVVHGAVALLLSRLSSCTDIVLGVPVNGRTAPEFAETVGLFVNTVVLRAQVADCDTVEELLAQLKSVMAGAQRNQGVAFERLVDELSPRRDASRNPLFQVLINYNSTGARPHLAGVELRPFDVEVTSARFELSFGFVESPDGLTMGIEFSTDLFDRSTIEGLAARFVRVLEQLLAPDTSLDDIEVLLPHEVQQLQRWGRGPELDLPPATTLDLIERQAEAHPDRIAVVADDSRLTYRQLLDRAAALAIRLRRHDVAGTHVGIALTRGTDLVVAQLGIWAAGAAYVPLDPAFPDARLQFMVTDADIGIVVGDEVSAPALRSLVGFVPPVEAAAPARSPGWRADISADAPAYVIYTSGSTGRPKGVVIEHTALVNFLLSMAAEPGCGPDDILLSVTTISFDISGLELLLPLLCGAQVVVATADVAADPYQLARTLADAKVTIMQATPSTWRLLVESGWAGQPLRALCGGEALSAELAAALVSRVAELWNMYGPTETTIWSTSARLAPTTLPPVTVGGPIANTSVTVRDGRLRLVPPGAVGQVFIGGTGTARGYWQRPDLTAERFVVLDGHRVYATGDLGRWRADGQLELLGRIDHQVKVRGHRIELGEIETRLEQAPGVAEAVVVVHQRDEGDQRLVAYVTPADPGAPPTQDAIGAALRVDLPAYMQPSAVVVLDVLPRTANNKVDRGALPVPRPEAPRAFSRPQTPLEQRLADVWADLLGIEDVSIDDDFFELGGHSLLAGRMVTRIGEVIDRPVPLRLVFTTGTIRALARELDVPATPGSAPADDVTRRLGHRLEAASLTDPDAVALALDGGVAQPVDPETWVDVLPASPAQQRMWMLHTLDPSSAAYNVPTVRRVTGPLDAARLRSALTALVGRHEILRTTYQQVGSRIAQVVHPAAHAAVELTLRSATSWSEIADEVRAEGHRPFDLTVAPALRACVWSLPGEVSYLLLTAHHITLDGGSLPILLRELAAGYDDAPLLPVRQYADATVTRPPTGDDDDEQFWRSTLAGAPTETTLPLDRPRGPDVSTRGGRVRRRLGATCVRDVEALARRHHGTAYMVVLAAVGALLHRHGAGNDIVLGTPTSGRTSVGSADVLGPLINTLPLRLRVEDSVTFDSLVGHSRDVVTEALAHDSLPFEAILELVDTVHDRGSHPLFQVVVAGQASSPERIRFGTASLEPVAMDWHEVRYDLTVLVDAIGDHLNLALDYRAELFDDHTAALLIDRLATLLAGAVAHPHTPIADLVVLTDRDLDVIGRLNDRADDRSEDARLLVTRVRDVAAREPATIAVRSGDVSLTFAELVRTADVVSADLRARGLGSGDVVGLAVGHHAEWLIGVLGIWGAGAAYLALDPLNPPVRSGAAVAETGTSLVIGSAAPPHAPHFPGVETVALDAAELLRREPVMTVASTLSPEALAYVVYTSGSSGEPKGSLIEHGSLTAFMHNLHSALPDPERRRTYSINAPLAFDASVQQLVHLGYGNTLDLVPDDIRLDPRAMVAYLRDHRVDVLDCTPTHLRMLIAQGLLTGPVDHDQFPGMLLVGGEAIENDLWEQLRAAAVTAFNCYGPTEATVQATLADVRETSSPTLGRPLPGVRTDVVDANGRPVPVGVPGELRIGGPQVGRGYLRRHELTAEKFVPAPDAAGGRAYLTGDLVALTRTGRLDFLGRIDDQVKVRGHRIELGEIDAAFNALPDVARAVTVLCQVDGAADLAVHLVLAASGAPESTTSVPDRVSAIRHEIRDRLPASMQPRWVVVTDHLPTTGSGKIDRAALATVDPRPLQTGGPETLDLDDPAQELVATVWGDVLGPTPFSPDDDFFDIGGNSLLAISVLSRLRELGVDLAVTTMFDRPTLARVAQAVTDELLGSDHP
ncbi:amino acid adenylation domain-containing protein [uncultured Jatrophihabitans sp.]|uniref:non-ribosomal peptide synthetase n=1 Tax=uncultured Jatrophihabitans sp. TaxID=1610747 RepID=UPI0035C9C69C